MNISQPSNANHPSSEKASSDCKLVGWSIQMDSKPLERILRAGKWSKSVIVSILITSAVLSRIVVAQIVSHELRKLAYSTNQFGIDVLKALDRIEPPDKVLVFCPICLSSSLAMIMMGSSKYQVVSALRQALYVPAMKPLEINKGYRDILEHIGLNQLQQSKTESKESRLSPDSWNSDNVNTFDSGRGISSASLSLPSLLNLREQFDSFAESRTRAWWLDVSKQTKVRPTRRIKELQLQQKDNGTVSTTNKLPETRGGLDYSQVSATSNIYIQRGLFLNYNYNLLLRQSYKTVVHPVDFQRHAEETRQHINFIVATGTEGKIKDLIKAGAFENPQANRAMIISTFHFRGTLDVHMKDPGSNRRRTARQETNAANKTLIDTSSPQVSKPRFIQIEETLMKYGSTNALDCTVIEIPFSNRFVSLLIVMPNNRNSTELALTRLNALVLKDLISTLEIKRISFEIPVIKFDRGPVNVKGLLNQLGLDKLFYGDLFYSSETGLNRWMRPSNMVHETSIDIGTINPSKLALPEDRLKVGAHDGKAARNSSVRVPEQSASDIHIRLDKPFFYFVLDSINGLILTMGRIRH